jgi:superfamily II DNA or RNA helicase
MIRDERQELGIDKYRATAVGTGILKGTLNYCTGFGKTRVATMIIDKLVAKRGNILFIVVVPTNDLKEQWEGLLTKHKNYQVLTIQGLTLRGLPLDCDLLILDEIHKMAANLFINVFDLIKYTHILGLTATYDRMDGRHILIDKYCPIIDTITLEEARRNEWIADFMQYNWGIEFDEYTKQRYDEISEQITKYFAYFDHNFNSMIQCSSVKGATVYLKRTTMIIPTEEEAKLQSQKANVCRNLISERTTMLDKAYCKVDATIEAVNYLNMKTVTFGLSQSMADALASKMPNTCSYHSSIRPKSKLTDILKDFKQDKYICLHTAKKADLGLDVPDLQAGVIYAGYNDPGVQSQRIGRLIRKEGTKEAVIINIYIKDTKDEWTVKNRQKGSSRVRWINSLNEIKL